MRNLIELVILKIDPMTSVTVNARIVPVLLLQQHRTIKLGPPYTDCTSQQKLDFFSKYTKKVRKITCLIFLTYLKNCHFECLIKEVFKKCKCRNGLFGVILMFRIFIYEDLLKTLYKRPPYLPKNADYKFVDFFLPKFFNVI